MDLIVFEDEHLLVVDKPPGWNTHAPAPLANEGVYDWLKHREPRWNRLAIIHRLDKETSGLLVFGKTPLANRSLTLQFENRQVAKKYIFLTDRPSSRAEFSATSQIRRAGEKYASHPSPGAPVAETRFKFLGAEANSIWQAEPLTGRTHQIRVHASEHGMPILGDTLYGGTPAARLCLHATELAFRHPATDQPLLFRATPRIYVPPSAQLRSAIIDSAQTSACRLIHGAADGWPNLYLDQWGEFLLAATDGALTAAQLDFIKTFPARGVYHKTLARQAVHQSAQWILGDEAPPDFFVRENGLNFKIRFTEGSSVGLFLDQRNNRRRLLTGYVAADFTFPPPREVLNAFAYTCAFSVCAAVSGATVTSIDLSRKYLDWGVENFLTNAVNSSAHQFLSGDAFQWFTRLAKKKRLFDLVILDPPTFSRSKAAGVFQAEKDYARLVSAALPLLKSGGILFVSTNAASYAAEDFLAAVTQSIHRAGRRITRQHYVPQPPDFPSHRSEPAYLKTVWLQVT